MSQKRTPVKFDSELVLWGDSYYYRGTPLGMKKRVERPIGIKKGALQKDVLKAKKEFLESIERAGSAAGKTTFFVVSQKYILEREEEAKDPTLLSPSSLGETKGVMKNHLIPYFGSCKVEEIDQSTFKDYCMIKKKKGLNLVNHRKVMNHFLKWCVHEKYLKYRLELEIPKHAQKARRERVVLTEDEIKKLIKACEGRVMLYVMMYLFMGLRNSEILMLRWDAIDFSRKALFVNPLSNRRRKARAIPINSFVLELLEKEAKKPRHSDRRKDYVFPAQRSMGKFPHINPIGGIRKPWMQALKRAGLDGKIQPHDLRSTFETFMHANSKFTDTQREKMAGAQIDVQKDTYVKMQVDHLRGLEESVNVDGIKELIERKTSKVTGGKSGGEELNKQAPRLASMRNQKQKEGSKKSR